MAKKKTTAQFIAFVLHCDELDKEVRASNASLSVSSDPCDICGSHESASVFFMCECGSFHDVIIYG